MQKLNQVDLILSVIEKATHTVQEKKYSNNNNIWHKQQINFAKCEVRNWSNGISLSRSDQIKFWFDYNNLQKKMKNGNEERGANF